MNEFSQAFVFFLQEFLPPQFTLPFLVLLLFGTSSLFLLIASISLIKCTAIKNHQRETAKKLAVAKEKAVKTLEHVNRQNIREAKLITLFKNERKHSLEKLKLLEEAREELRLQFASLAQQIFDEKSEKFSELNRTKLDAILQPFSNQLSILKQEINEIYHNDSRERTSLKSEILQLRDLNQQVNQEATNLTNALKSDTRIQGNWGELVLERVLERSGLRNGIEYETQGGFRDHNNRLLKPDVIIHLPEGKDLIIDSKVSLMSWEKYVNSEHEEARAHYLNAMMTAIRDHITTLSKKNYPGLTGIHSLDFVLMFMPIEAAFSTAFQSDDNLFTEALAKNIIIVTPTTLLATLRTVQNIWNYEHQSKNSLEIARRAGIMYDKFRFFVEEMEKMGKQLATCHATYEGALLKLTRGRGNLIAQAEQLKQLGVKAKKEIPKTITDIAELDASN